jgi:hypothetical protein
MGTSSDLIVPPPIGTERLAPVRARAVAALGLGLLGLFEILVFIKVRSL